MSQWSEFVAAHAEGGVLDGVVARVVPFGAFVEVADGIHGL
ncbi:MAG TPA: S1 RNA-binding domain-containing protein, partial [Amycolatopsis sp.]